MADLRDFQPKFDNGTFKDRLGPVDDDLEGGADEAFRKTPGSRGDSHTVAFFLKDGSVEWFPYNDNFRGKMVGGKLVMRFSSATVTISGKNLEPLRRHLCSYRAAEVRIGGPGAYGAVVTGIEVEDE